jgi:hypothetical protein
MPRDATASSPVYGLHPESIVTRPPQREPAPEPLGTIPRVILVSNRGPCKERDMTDQNKPKASKTPAPPETHQGGKPVPDHGLTAEQAREAQEAEAARNAEASIRDRMVHIGRGNQQSGRQGS